MEGRPRGLVVQILVFLGMRPTVGIDRSPVRIIAVLGERSPGTVFRHRNGCLGMAGVGLVQHRAKVREMSGVPAEVTVVTDGVGNAHDGDAKDGGVTDMRWDSYLAAIRKGRGAIRVL